MKLFTHNADIKAHFSDKSDGNMALSQVSTYQGNIVQSNRLQWLQKLRIQSSHVIFVNPQNEAETFCFSTLGGLTEIYAQVGEFSPSVDAIFTSCANVFLALPVADCPLLFVYEKSYGIVGLIHAGWHGLNKEIVLRALTQMKKAWDVSDLSQLEVEVSPYFHWYRKLHGDVSRPTQDFWKAKKAFEVGEQEFLFNIQRMIFEQLLDVGVGWCQTNWRKACDTYNDPDEQFFSHRRDKNKENGRNMGIIGKVK